MDAFGSSRCLGASNFCGEVGSSFTPLCSPGLLSRCLPVCLPLQVADHSHRPGLLCVAQDQATYDAAMNVYAADFPCTEAERADICGNTALRLFRWKEANL